MSLRQKKRSYHHSLIGDYPRGIWPCTAPGHQQPPCALMSMHSDRSSFGPLFDLGLFVYRLFHASWLQANLYHDLQSILHLSVCLWVQFPPSVLPSITNPPCCHSPNLSHAPRFSPCLVHSSFIFHLSCHFPLFLLLSLSSLQSTHSLDVVFYIYKCGSNPPLVIGSAKLR